MLHRRLGRRLVPALLALPLTAGLAVPAALSFGEQGGALPDLGMASDGLGPGDGLDRFVVTVDRDLPPQKPGGAVEPTWTGEATYDQNIANLSRAEGVEAVVPLGGNAALVAVEAGTSARVLPFVRSAEPAATVTPHAVPAPDDEYFGYDWALSNSGSIPVLQSAQVAGADVDALTAWEHSRGDGVVVAVIDNGYDATHPDMAAALWTNPDEGCDPAVDRDGNGYRGDCHGWNYYRGSGDVSNIVDGRHLATHGTPVASMIAAEAGNGVGSAGLAPRATIMPVVIGGGADLFTAYVAPAIRYAADNGADIINMSFGIGGNVPEVEAAVRYAASRGVLMVASAGNSGGVDRDVQPVWPVSYQLPEMMGVGSSTPSDGIAGHSDVGASTVHLFAPGQEVLVANAGGGYGLSHGTSFAAPLTAGAAALVMAARPDLTAVEVRDLLVRTAEPVPSMAGRSVSGGRLDAGRAMATVAAPAQVSLHGLSTVAAKTAGTATVRVEGTGAGLPAGALSLRVSLGAYRNGYVYAVADLPLDAGAAGAGATGQDGSVVLTPPGLTAAALAEGVDVPLTMTLPQGRYGLVTQLLAGGEPVTPPQAAAFTVRPAASGGGSDGTPEAPAPGAPAPAAPAPSTPAPDAPAPGAPEPAPGAPAPGTPAPGTPAPGTPAPVSPAPGTPAPGTPAPGTPAPGTPAPGTPAPGTPAPGTPAPGTPAPGTPAPGTPAPGTPAPVAPAPAPPTPVAPAPVAPAPGSPAPVAPAPGSPAPVAPAPGTPAPVAPSPDAPADTTCGATRFDGSGTFGITAISPNCGALAGGTTVTITGARLPADAAVRVGTSAATVLPGGTATSLSIRTPARGTSGPVDVVVYAPDRAVSEVLAGAFTYLADDAAGGSGGDTGAGGGSGDEPGTGGGTGGGDGGTGTGEGGGTGGGGTGSGGASGPASDPADFEGLTLVDTGGDVGGLTAAGMALLTDCGASCFATRLAP